MAFWTFNDHSGARSKDSSGKERCQSADSISLFFIGRIEKNQVKPLFGFFAEPPDRPLGVDRENSHGAGFFEAQNIKARSQLSNDPP